MDDPNWIDWFNADGCYIDWIEFDGVTDLVYFSMSHNELKKPRSEQYDQDPDALRL